MKNFLKNQYLLLLRKQGIKAGIVPVKNPENEGERLAEVKRLGIMELDLSGERRYNSMTQVATYLTGCTQSAINILGSSVQQCKANFGFNMLESTMLKEVPREISVCQFSLDNPGKPLIIENILEDERTKNMKNMPFDLGFRFYAGAPLISSRGFSLGVLCVFDPTPKNLAHQQVEGLRLLSDQVVHMLENESISLGTTVPEEETEEETSQLQGQYYSVSSILFADFVGFTNMVENCEPGELLDTLNTFFSGFDRIMSKHNVRKVKTVGDCYMCVCGILPSQQGSHAHDVCSAAVDMLKFVEGINMQHEALGKPRWELRIGIHSGPVIAGTAGNTFDIWGDAVNIAARLESSGESGKIHISEKTKDYLEGAGSFTPRGKVELKNKGTWSTFFLDELN